MREPEPSGDGAVSLTLSAQQVEQVVRRALGQPSAAGVATLLHERGFDEDHVRRALGERYRALQGNRRLSRSLLAGLLVLSCFTREGAELGIKDISEELDLNSSTVHRYVATLLAAGLLERDPESRRYRLLGG